MKKARKSSAAYVRDGSGLWHYNPEAERLSFHEALKSALENKPEGPAWFWFNDKPVPIETGDTPEKLEGRWDSFWIKPQKANNKPTFRQLLLKYTYKKK